MSLSINFSKTETINSLLVEMPTFAVDYQHDLFQVIISQADVRHVYGGSLSAAFFGRQEDGSFYFRLKTADNHKVFRYRSSAGNIYRWQVDPEASDSVVEVDICFELPQSQITIHEKGNLFPMIWDLSNSNNIVAGKSYSFNETAICLGGASRCEVNNTPPVTSNLILANSGTSVVDQDISSYFPGGVLMLEDDEQLIFSGRDNKDYYLATDISKVLVDGTGPELKLILNNTISNISKLNNLNSLTLTGIASLECNLAVVRDKFIFNMSELKPVLVKYGSENLISALMKINTDVLEGYHPYDWAGEDGLVEDYHSYGMGQAY